MKINILAIAVHPDDAELCCAGTLLKHKAMGYKIGIVDLTQGELGTRGNAELRLEESNASSKILGLDVRENLGMPDGFFTHSRENLVSIARMVRRYQPEVVLANALSDRHPDHGRASKLISDACFIAGLVKVGIEDNGQALERWRPRAIYHFIQDHMHHPEFCVDITAFYEQKLDAIRCFKSQFYDPDSKEPESPISGKDFLSYVEAYARAYGRRIGVTYGEGFNVERPIGVPNIMDLF